VTDARGRLLIAALVLFLGACAIANTPQQDLAYARWAKCNSPYVSLQQIDLDGRITFRSATAGSGQEVLQCLAEAGRTGPPLPEPMASAHRQACERPTRPTPASSRRLLDSPAATCTEVPMRLIGLAVALALDVTETGDHARPLSRQALDPKVGPSHRKM
jgi:hypothetical protein